MPRWRRLSVLGALSIVAVVLVILLANLTSNGEFFGVGSSQTASTTKDSEPPTSAESTAVEPTPIHPSSVSASSSFSEDLGPANLVDGDADTYWNDASLHGDGAELVFEFSGPISISEVVIQNVIDEVAFRRNYRIRGYEITTDDLPTVITGEIADTQEPQRISITSDGTTRLVFRVTSSYEAESVGSQPPFEELAVAEMTVLGRTESG